MAAIVVLLLACAVSFASKAKDTEQARRGDPEGQSVILKKAILAGVSKEDHFALSFMASTEDKEGASRMIRQGKALLLPKGTKVSVL